MDGREERRMKRVHSKRGRGDRGREAAKHVNEDGQG